MSVDVTYAICSNFCLSAYLQDFPVQPDELCTERSLPKPHPLSMTSPDLLAHVYERLASIGQDP